MISPKDCNLSERLLLLLNNFEETLGGRLRKLNPTDQVTNSAKGKVLMRAMYGVKVEMVFIYSVFSSPFSGSAIELFDLNVDDKGFCGLKLLLVCKLALIVKLEIYIQVEDLQF